MTGTWTSVTDGAAGASSMVTPNTLLIASRGFVCKATAADSTWLAPPAVVSVTTTVRITLPAVAVTVSKHAGKEHCSSWRKLASTESATAANSSTVPPTLSTKVTSLAGTISVTAPGGNGGGEGGGGEGGGGDGGGGEAGGSEGGGRTGGVDGGGDGEGAKGGGGGTVRLATREEASELRLKKCMARMLPLKNWPPRSARARPRVTLVGPESAPALPRRRPTSTPSMMSQ